MMLNSSVHNYLTSRECSSILRHDKYIIVTYKINMSIQVGIESVSFVTFSRAWREKEENPSGELRE